MNLKLNKWTLAAALGALLLASVLAHTFNPGPMPILLSQLMDSLHAPAFALIVALLVALLRHYPGIRHVYLWAIAAAAVIGILSEASQVYGPRDADIADLKHDIFGIMSGVVLAFLLFGDLVSRSRWRIRIAGATTVVLLVCVPMIVAAHAISRQRSLLPQLAAFSEPWEERLYEESLLHTLTIVAVPGAKPGEPERVARLDMSNKLYPGFLMYPYSDWRSYNTVNLLVASASEVPLDITIRIDDIWHNHAYTDRFNRNYTIGPDWQTIRIPLPELVSAPADREIDLGNISSIIIFAGDPPADARLYLSGITLE